MKPGLKMGLGSFADTNIFVKKYYFLWFLFLFSDFFS